MRVQPLELLPADVLGPRVGPDLPAEFHFAGPEQRQGEYVVGGGGHEFPQRVFDAGHIGDHADEKRPVGALRQSVDVLPDPRPVPRGGGLPQPAGLGKGGGEFEVGGGRDASVDMERMVSGGLEAVSSQVRETCGNTMPKQCIPAST